MFWLLTSKSQDLEDQIQKGELGRAENLRKQGVVVYASMLLCLFRLGFVSEFAKIDINHPQLHYYKCDRIVHQCGVTYRQTCMLLYHELCNVSFINRVSCLPTTEAPSFLSIGLQGARAVVDDGHRVKHVRVGIHAPAHDVQLAPVSLQSPCQSQFRTGDDVNQHKSRA